jgi:hypothetical protein
MEERFDRQPGWLSAVISELVTCVNSQMEQHFDRQAKQMHMLQQTLISTAVQNNAADLRWQLSSAPRAPDLASQPAEKTLDDDDQGQRRKSARTQQNVHVQPLPRVHPSTHVAAGVKRPRFNAHPPPQGNAGKKPGPRLLNDGVNTFQHYLAKMTHYPHGCLFCGEDCDPEWECPKVESMPIRERWTRFRTRQKEMRGMSCGKCFSKTHREEECGARCGVDGCQKAHHFILHQLMK